MARMSAASFLFVVVYNFFYYALYLVCIAFLVVTPADLIQQAFAKKQNWNILVVTVCYVVTVLVIFFIYVTRIYISRSVLSSIPKSWIPIDKGDVPRSVREMIVEGLSRSAAIAYEARPRVPHPMIQPVTTHTGTVEEKQKSSWRGKWRSKSSGSGGAVSVIEGGDAIGLEMGMLPDQQQQRAVWGDIEHPGWSSPVSTGLPPNLQYSTVVSELPNLIEAKALTLAPPDPDSRTLPPTLDPEAVAMLQRPEGGVGLREYLGLLTEMGVLTASPTIIDFLSQYERARFSARPLTSDEFRELMHLFAEVLRSMQPFDPALAYDDYDDDSFDDGIPQGEQEGEQTQSESDIDNDAPRGTSPSSAGQSLHSGLGLMIGIGQNAGGDNDSLGGKSSSASTTWSQGRRSRHLRPGMGVRNSSANTWLYQTAPTTPKSTRHAGVSDSSGDSDANSFAQTRHPYQVDGTSGSGSGRSVRSVGTNGSGGSVIRLAADGDGTDMPYVFTGVN
ncbi:hypothetical protein QC763_309480 [Podospora pseudopauciseta]|uniref:Defect at low temperature protein 1 n=1 Tax=Podospora pseudopauciseta TaxID=2093780 RepID=A0ABR0HHW7_9PEZI|nr:hypothetical protein QC763_309480 [Podospora pseudopauciseta]